MLHLKILIIFEIIIFWGSFSFVQGIPGDKALIIGALKPPSFISVKEIPNNSASSFDNFTLKFTPEIPLIFSLASDPKNSVVFAAIMNGIYIFKNFSILQNSVIELPTEYRGRSIAYGQIAFDFVSNNIYWCDSLLNWIALKPAYSFKNTIYKVIIHKDLVLPEGLAVDPEDGLIFFSDNDHNARIEKAFLDGQNRVSIVYKGLSKVSSLTVDTANNKLYWADSSRLTLEGCNYDGSNRRVIRRLNDVLVSGLTYHQNILHAVSSSTNLMFGVNTTSGYLLYSRKLPTLQPFAITLYDNEPPVTFNDPCSTLNCQHMCVNTQSGPKCLCSEGFDLNSDNKTCTDASIFYAKGFIVSNASMFVMHEIIANGQKVQDNIIKYIPGTIIESLAIDSNLDIIYLVDGKSSSLKKYNIRSNQLITLTSISASTDLIFDWIANLLGWIEPRLSSIQSFSVNSQITDTIYSSLQNPESLTVDPYTGELYWIVGAPEKSIVRGSWTRNAPKVLISAANLNSPRSLQFDVTSQRLYWLEHTFIKSSKANGSDIKSHINTKGAKKIFAYKGYFVWINEDDLHFHIANTFQAEYTLPTLQNPRDAAVFDSSLQDDKRGTCHILNGGCEEICLPVENGRRCECDIGLKLQPDQSCDSDLFSSNFILVTDFSHGRILQIDLQNGTVVKLPLSVNKATGLAFDKSTMKLFFSDNSTKTITSTALHGRDTEVFYTPGFAYAASLDIDYSTGNLYYTAVGPTASQSYIGVVHRTTAIHKTLLNNMGIPHDITLCPSKGYFFWTEIGNKTKIGRAIMDGTTPTYIATRGIEMPNGLTADCSASRLFWTDGFLNRIEFSNFNGENRHVLASDSDAFINDIVIQGRYLFYTAWNRQSITKIDKITGSTVQFMSDHPEFGRLDSLDIYADEMRDVSSNCSIKNGLCSTFCFPTPTGRTCGCQDNVNLQSDQVTCEGVVRCQTLQRNLNFTDCLPYPGQSCNVNCKTGYQLVINRTVSCGSDGQWIPSTDTICKGKESTSEARQSGMIYIYMNAVLSAVGAIVVSMVIVGFTCLMKRKINNTRKTAKTSSSSTRHDTTSTFESHGYTSDEEEHYHTIDPVYDTMHDGYNEPRNPYLVVLE